jgi:hypothetical protein
MVNRFTPPGGCRPRPTAILQNALQDILRDALRSPLRIRLTQPAREAWGLFLAARH